MELYEGKCDICTKPDGTRDHNLQKCHVCSVLVHELCHGMPPTTTKDANFTCHACKAIGTEIEVNVPSKIGGWSLKDVLVKKEGVLSLKEFLDGEQKKRSVGDTKRVDFYAAVSDFQDKTKEEVDDELFGDVKSQAQHIFDVYCARDAEKKVKLPSHILSMIDATIFNNEGESAISSTLFDEAKQTIYHSLDQCNLLGRYKESTQFKTYIGTQRTTIKQEERPSECALCSVKTGTHAMHPLYDMDGKHGRQLLLPATGVGFKRKPARLAWVHTLCAMFICSSPKHGGLIYGCMEDGSYEAPDEEESDEEGDAAKKGKIIESSDDEEEDTDDSTASLVEEQRKFTQCEIVFQPLLERSQEASHSNAGSNEEKDAAIVLECINSMIKNVELLTPSFVEIYPIGKTVSGVKKLFEGSHPEVRAQCKLLSAEMKRVYRSKEKNVPDGFEPVKNLRWIGGGQNRKLKSNEKSEKSSISGVMEKQQSIVSSNNNQDNEPRYAIGTPLSKKFHDKWFDGKITSYDSNLNLYHVDYQDGDSEDLAEEEVSQLLLTHTKWFCISPSVVNGKETMAGSCLKALRELQCVICKKKDNASKHCLRIPVQCIASDRHEFKEFKQYHRQLNREIKLAKVRGEEKHDGCVVPMHVGCARWGNEYAHVKHKDLRMCYYFSGKPPTYTGPDDYKDPVSNCFCRVHAIEIQNSLAITHHGKRSPKRKRVDDDAGVSGNESDDSAEKSNREQVAIAKKKKVRRIMLESDEESD
ncbi:hypothetical protein ACHAXR_011004 [Thalassiosira sp. AJA248-18]